MESVIALLAGNPEIALFLALAVGHAVGAIHFGPFQLGGQNDMQDGQVNALPRVISRVPRVEVADTTVLDGERGVAMGVTIRRTRRDGNTFKPMPDEVLRAGDVMLVVGRRDPMVAFVPLVGTEAFGDDTHHAEFDAVVQCEQSVLPTRREIIGLTLPRLRQVADAGAGCGV